MEAATVGLMLADVGLKEMSRSSAERLRYASLAHGLRTPNGGFHLHLFEFPFMF